MSDVFNDSSTVMSEAGWGGTGSDDFRHIADKEERDKVKKKAIARSAKVRRWQAVRDSTFSDADYAEEEARLAREVEEMVEARRAA
ncbi:hypothetical protein [Roseovarius indicus]|uniref:hypothetical protein n=1 Tax=Roseovarius indicus TaxID=540747 RepID=UPI0007D9AC32|nr:hypothetical protein [Roseovarius indicus]OAO05907.1 hypothetical protein A8B76_11940 [Roseovarius indicus]